MLVAVFSTAGPKHIGWFKHILLNLGVKNAKLLKTMNFYDKTL